MPNERLDPVICLSCGARFPVECLSEDEYQALMDQHDHQEFSEELRMLRKVSDFYRRYPEAAGAIKSHISHLLASDDPEIIEMLCEGTPFDQIELPPDQLPLSPEVIETEAEVIEYLRNNDFSLVPRLAFVRERLGRLEGNMILVNCRSCRSGWLRLDLEYWGNPNVF